MTAEIIQQEAKGERSERLGEGTEPSLGSKINSLCKNKQSLQRIMREVPVGIRRWGFCGRKGGIVWMFLRYRADVPGN